MATDCWFDYRVQIFASPVINAAVLTFQKAISRNSALNRSVYMHDYTLHCSRAVCNKYLLCSSFRRMEVDRWASEKGTVHLRPFMERQRLDRFQVAREVGWKPQSTKELAHIANLGSRDFVHKFVHSICPPSWCSVLLLPRTIHHFLISSSPLSSISHLACVMLLHSHSSIAAHPSRKAFRNCPHPPIPYVSGNQMPLSSRKGK